MLEQWLNGSVLFYTKIGLLEMNLIETEIFNVGFGGQDEAFWYEEALNAMPFPFIAWILEVIVNIGIIAF